MSTVKHTYTPTNNPTSCKTETQSISKSYSQTNNPTPSQSYTAKHTTTFYTLSNSASPIFELTPSLSSYSTTPDYSFTPSVQTYTPSLTPNLPTYDSLSKTFTSSSRQNIRYNQTQTQIQNQSQDKLTILFYLIGGACGLIVGTSIVYIWFYSQPQNKTRAEKTPPKRFVSINPLVTRSRSLSDDTSQRKSLGVSRTRISSLEIKRTTT
jgi:hypothetical protein